MRGGYGVGWWFCGGFYGGGAGVEIGGDGIIGIE